MSFKLPLVDRDSLLTTRASPRQRLQNLHAILLEASEATRSVGHWLDSAVSGCADEIAAALMLESPPAVMLLSLEERARMLLEILDRETRDEK